MRTSSKKANLCITQLQKYFPFWQPENGWKNCLQDKSIVYKMKVLSIIAYIQHTISLLLYLLKRYIDKVTESDLQAIKVSGDVEKLVTIFRKVCQSLKILHLIKRTLKSFWSTVEKLRQICSVIEEISKYSCYIFVHKTLLKIFCQVLEFYGNLVPMFRYLMQLWSNKYQTSICHRSVAYHRSFSVVSLQDESQQAASIVPAVVKAIGKSYIAYWFG